MKLQCPCGAKYAFDLAPEMLANPVSFLCPACGADHSAFVNELVRQEFAPSAPEPVAPAAPPPPPPTGSRLKISHAAAPATPAPETGPISKYCAKHRGVLATEHCAECGKPICPECMTLFGYFCSPLCKNKADLKGKDVPVFAGQKSEVESRFWRKMGLVFGAVAVLVLSAIGFWGWYQFYGSRPHAIFSQRFEQRSLYGGAEIVHGVQLVFLHGGTLARVDLKSKKPVWTQEVITKKEYADAIAAEIQADSGSTYRSSQTKLEKSARKYLEGALALRVEGERIWVARGAKETRYDWATGSVAEDKKIIPRDFTGADDTGGGLPLNPNDDPNRPLDPDKVTAQAQNLKLPAQIALPALLANARNQQQLAKELKDDPRSRPATKKPSAATPADDSLTRVVHGGNGDWLFTVRLLERRMVTRSAMKAPPKKSALEGEVNQARTMEIANETLNEMQRHAGGDTIEEDESRYQVSVRKVGEPATSGWTGEVVGPPQLHLLKTVNVLTAGKGVVVLDADNKKIWSASLTYAVPGAARADDAEGAQFGEGPCVERGNTLYVFDQAVLTAFDLTSGNARWRLPSVGVAGLFFDAQDNVIVNTTSGSPDDIKYSRQIDVTKTTDAIVQKISGQSGKILWTARPAGHVAYVAGNIIYAMRSYDSGFDPEEDGNDLTDGLQKKDYFRLVRLDPKSGRELWTYEQQRAPSSVRFSGTAIALVFKKEVQVLKYLAF
jgi:hypothetical protein